MHYTFLFTKKQGGKMKKQTGDICKKIGGLMFLLIFFLAIAISPPLISWRSAILVGASFIAMALILIPGLKSEGS